MQCLIALALSEIDWILDEVEHTFNAFLFHERCILNPWFELLNRDVNKI
jgi:hypothetical protein